ncbi:pantoate--beta-alanine ligase [Trichomonascus vanleenenianus]|uniref:pantoate--beta-alanine ligase PAN6 n=1 Tax=Trichomonascus vanleenenianus TaxID=2268995 RepID=UPI003EC98A0D
MGALHQGHLNLVSASLKENDSTIVSVFVNPSQFAPGEDLDQYPRTWEKDMDGLMAVSDEQSNIAVFAPTVSEMYPSGISLQKTEQRGAFVEVLGLSEQLEGSIRPHFFRGVATVVTKLLNATTPDKAYFGQKDVQQTVVVKRLVKDLLMPSEIVVIPTAREANGLAMSSRNEYLSEESRKRANILFNALSAGESVFKNSSADTVSRKDILDTIHEVLASSDYPVEVEYIALSDKEDLRELDEVAKGSGAIISGAVRLPNKLGHKTRIIDNLIL